MPSNGRMMAREAYRRGDLDRRRAGECRRGGDPVVVGVC